MELRSIPNVLEVQTTNIRAYMKSRNYFSIEKTFIELYEIHYGMSAMLSEIRRCKNDAQAHLEGGAIPVYALLALEKVRRYQVELRNRSPTFC